MQAINNIENKLDDYIGKTWMYRGRNIFIKGFKIDGDTAILLTKSQPVVTPLSKLDETLGEMLESDDDDTNEKMMQLFTGNKGNMTNLESVLMDNINKVKSDPKFLGQAKQINSDVNAILKIQKTKLEIVKEMRKNKG